MIWGSLSHDMVNLRIIGKLTNNASGHIHLQVELVFFKVIIIIIKVLFDRISACTNHWTNMDRGPRLHCIVITCILYITISCVVISFWCFVLSPIAGFFCRSPIVAGCCRLYFSLLFGFWFCGWLCVLLLLFAFFFCRSPFVTGCRCLFFRLFFVIT